MPRSLIFCVLLGMYLFSIALPPMTYAQEETEDRVVEVVGTGVIRGENIATGREQAISDSLVSAVFQVMSSLLPYETIVNNFQIINESLYSQTNIYVKDYKVLIESVAGKTYRVMVQATVSSDRIAGKLSELGIMLAKQRYPTLLFLIAEQNLYDDVPPHWWGEETIVAESLSEAALTAAMVSKGFMVIDHKNLSEALNLPLEIDDQSAVSLGKRFGADIVVIGKSLATIAPNTMGEDIKSFNGSFTAKAIRIDTGEVIAETNRTSVATGADELTGSNDALSTAGTLAGDDLAAQIIAGWQQDTSKPEMIELTVEGIGGNIASFVRFRGILSEMSGVNSLQLKEMMADMATVLVDFQGSAKALADSLLKQNYVGFGINIYEIQQSQLKIRLVSD